MSAALLVLALFVVAAVWAAAGVALALQLMGRLERNTADTEFTLAAKRLRASMLEVQIVFRDALGPTMLQAAEAINNLMKAFGKAK